MKNTNDFDSDYVFNNIDCQSYNFNDIDTNSSITSSKFNLLHQNIRSARQTNLDEIFNTIDSLKTNFDILFLSETWFDESILNCANSPNYNAFHSIRPNNKRGGGVSIYVHNKYKSTPIPSFNVNNDYIESVAVKINFCESIYNFICLYRPPNSSIVTFNTKI